MSIEDQQSFTSTENEVTIYLDKIFLLLETHGSWQSFQDEQDWFESSFSEKWFDEIIERDMTLGEREEKSTLTFTDTPPRKADCLTTFYSHPIENELDSKPKSHGQVKQNNEPIHIQKEDAKGDENKPKNNLKKTTDPKKKIRASVINKLNTNSRIKNNKATKNRDQKKPLPLRLEREAYTYWRAFVKKHDKLNLEVINEGCGHHANNRTNRYYAIKNLLTSIEFNFQSAQDPKFLEDLSQTYPKKRKENKSSPNTNQDNHNDSEKLSPNKSCNEKINTHGNPDLPIEVSKQMAEWKKITGLNQRKLLIPAVFAKLVLVGRITKQWASRLKLFDPKETLKKDFLDFLEGKIKSLNYLSNEEKKKKDKAINMFKKLLGVRNGSQKRSKP